MVVVCAEPGAKIYQVAARFSVLLSFTDKLLRCQRTGYLTATTPYCNIDDVYLTARRNRIAVALPPNGFLNDYVLFYLGPRSPILYRIGRHQPQSGIIPAQ